MSTHPDILTQIRTTYFAHGLGPALHTARVAYVSGRIDPRDIAEIFLALRTGSWAYFEEPGRISRHPETASVRAA